LQQAVREARVIPSGVDQTVFHPANRRQARIDLGLPEDALILLFVAQRMRQNPFKDYETIQRAVQIVSSQKNSREVLFLSLGSTENDTVHQDLNIRHIPFTSDITLVAWYYQAADIYLHAAHEDTFPNVVLEALSCGVPVIATAVGGIPEQIIDGKTGFLVPPRDAEAIARQILILLNDPAACREMGQNAQEDARSRFNLDLMVSRYRDYYRHIQEVS
jgi:glycosyltransferase involved in cell wall biosynthesis